MRMTEHGSERIQLRTRMTEHDVLDIVKAKAGVHLGEQKHYRYLLFYSPPDQRAKIAVYTVSHDGSESLVSVWEQDYYLPPGITKPKQAHIRRARKALHDYLFSRSRVPSQKGKSKVKAHIAVYEGRRKAFTHEVGLLDRELVFDRDALWESQKDTLLHISKIIHDNAEIVRGKVALEVHLFDPDDGSLVSSHKFKHRKLLTKLETA